MQLDDQRSVSTMVLVGAVLLMVVSMTIGFVIADERHSRQRERLDARRWELWLWEQELLNLAELRGCPSCQLLRQRSDLQRSPIN